MPRRHVQLCKTEGDQTDEKTSRSFSLLRCLGAGPHGHTGGSVNTTNDGSGVCTTDPASNGVCTLRATIQAAAALGGSNAILVPAGIYVLRQPALCAPLATTGITALCPTGDLTIAGAGAQQTVIDGNAQGRVSIVTGPGTNVALNGITIRNGSLTLGAGGPVTELSMA
jgi:hypothetical protein